MTYLITNNKADCTACGACAQICGHQAISMEYDNEAFAYPVIDKDKCIDCGACVKVCPLNEEDRHPGEIEFKPLRVFGGSHKDDEVLINSTSGGAFTAFCQAWSEQSDYVIYGAFADGLYVRHVRLTSIDDLKKICKSKYRQSEIGTCFKSVRQDLVKGRKVLFSGTPCHIGGLISFLKNIDRSNLLTIEVICEGVPSPLFIEKMSKGIFGESASDLEGLDYRCKKKSFGSPMKWDFEMMQASFRSRPSWTRDRWFNPFWNVWLKHLMSRPSCYDCRYACPKRVADVTLGDLWGVHLYCPDLYNMNKGASLVICNSEKGAEWLEKAMPALNGHDLNPQDALRYQGPLRKKVQKNPNREAFMADLMNEDSTYDKLVEKWYDKPSLKLIISKYVWGNRNKVWLWNFLRHFKINYRIR